MHFPNRLITNFFLIMTIILMVFPSSYAQGASSDDSGWLAVETGYLRIRYRNLKSLVLFDQKIDYQPRPGRPRLKFQTGDDTSLERGIITKVNAIFEKVQEILDMRKKYKKVTVNIYDNSEGLKRAFREIYKTSSRLRAWYIYENNTIYLNVEDLHQGMLAHEMAHSIIDHYLKVRPPYASAEILARYVDSHLVK
jgi:hypothetical protein